MNPVSPKSFYGGVYSSEGVQKDKPPYVELIFVKITILIKAILTL